jgi:hypothetical protein
MGKRNHLGYIKVYESVISKGKGKAILVTGREGSQDCETLRFPHFLDNRLIDGGKVVRLTRRPPFTPQ